MGLLQILGGGGVHDCVVVCVVWLEEEPRVGSSDACYIDRVAFPRIVSALGTTTSFIRPQTSISEPEDQGQHIKGSSNILLVSRSHFCYAPQRC